MLVKRAAALAAGMVVAVGLFAGCAQKPGVAAVVTPVTCHKSTGASSGTAPVPQYTGKRWVCKDGWRAVEGTSQTITSNDLADVRPGLVAAGVSVEGTPVATGTQTLDAMVVVSTTLRVAKEQGITVTDLDAIEWLRQGLVSSGLANDKVAAWIESNVKTGPDAGGWMLWAKFNAVGQAAAGQPDGGQAFSEAVNTALQTQTVVVNPRFGTFDYSPESMAVVAPTWAAAAA